MAGLQLYTAILLGVSASHHNTAVLWLDAETRQYRSVSCSWTTSKAHFLCYCMCAAVRMMNDMLHLPASAGSCAEPVGTGSISRQLAAVAVAIFACMHVCRSPFYVVCFMLQWLADDVSIGVLIRTGSLKMLPAYMLSPRN